MENTSEEIPYKRGYDRIDPLFRFKHHGYLPLLHCSSHLLSTLMSAIQQNGILDKHGSNLDSARYEWHRMQDNT